MVLGQPKVAGAFDGRDSLFRLTGKDYTFLGFQTSDVACPDCGYVGTCLSEDERSELEKKLRESPHSTSLGYVILYVKDVSATLTFYEKAFGLSRRFFSDDHGKAYGELETGAARLAFASLELAKEHLKQEVAAASPNTPPPGFEIALVTPDVPAMYARAVKAGAATVSEPAAKPWGQTVAYLRDKDGHLIELCTAMP